MIRFTRARKIATLMAVTSLVALAAQPARALVFHFDNLGGVSALQFEGFVAAGNLWSGLLSDNITVEIALVGQDFEGLAETYPEFDLYSYASVREALAADSSSADDVSAVSNLQTGPLRTLLNGTSDRPAETEVLTPYLDENDSANNNVLILSDANAKALGLFGTGLGAFPDATSSDGTILFNNALSLYDYTPEDGINGADFVGIATHEIGHILGFLCGCEQHDAEPGNLSEDSFFFTPMDLFRFSTSSIANGFGVPDWTIGTLANGNTSDARYFSVDGGRTSATPTAFFSLGAGVGDGFEASHWRNNAGPNGSIIGVMDPAIERDQRFAVSPLDRRLFDVIGYNLTAAPEPGTLPLLGVALLGTAGILRTRRRD